MKSLSVAVSTRTVYTRPTDPHDGLSRDWVKIFEHFNLCPVLIPNGLKDPVSLVKNSNAAALLLTGGDDLPEQWPAAKPSPRDRTESLLLEYGLGNNMPVLGVCRGLQFLNLWFGGGQTRDLKNVETGHLSTNHKISIHGFFSELVQQDSIVVNSFHNHGVLQKDLAPDLKILGRTAAGVVEAFCHTKKPVYAIQWHPERAERFSLLDHYLFGEFLRI